MYPNIYWFGSNWGDIGVISIRGTLYSFDHFSILCYSRKFIPLVSSYSREEAGRRNMMDSCDNLASCEHKHTGLYRVEWDWKGKTRSCSGTCRNPSRRHSYGLDRCGSPTHYGRMNRNHRTRIFKHSLGNESKTSSYRFGIDRVVRPLSERWGTLLLVGISPPEQYNHRGSHRRNFQTSADP